MKIVFLSRYQNRIQRGAETFVMELSKRLSKKHEISILSGSDADSINRVYEEEYQIVISLNGGVQSLKASLGRLRKNYRLVVTGQAGIGKGEIFNLLFAKPDLYVALTETMLQWAKQWAWGTRVIKIPNGVDTEKFNPKGNRFNFILETPVILSVGALVWYKHHERTIEALSILSRGSLVLVGEGPERNKLETMGRKLLGARFKILHVDYKDLPSFYRGANLFVLPSWEKEAFGIVYLEAMATGLGVVAPDNASRREIIGDAGIFVDVSDTKKYADAIERALGMSWRQKALKQSEKFSWEKIAKQYEEAFEKLI